MATLNGMDVMDGNVKIATIIREESRYNDAGYVLCLVPEAADDPAERAGWKKYMGTEQDETWIAELFACSICGSCADTRFFEPTKSRLLAKRICFTCDHWLQIIEKDASEDKDRCVIVSGKHYYMGENTSTPHRWSGFGGHEFRIKFLDGREAVCNNLWHQGTIPARFRHRLPDNAQFVK